MEIKYLCVKVTESHEAAAGEGEEEVEEEDEILDEVFVTFLHVGLKVH